MAKYARVTEADRGIVVEIIDSEQPINELFHPELARAFHPASADVQIGYSYTDGVFSLAVASLEELRQTKLIAVAAKAGELLVAGAPVSGGLHVALDDGSRADLTAMAATATAATTGAVPWPESYSRGWISIENDRIPLATPADGLALAASAGNYYAAIVQHRRDLKDAALAAADEAALAAIDVTAGWPTNG